MLVSNGFFLILKTTNYVLVFYRVFYNGSYYNSLSVMNSNLEVTKQGNNFSYQVISLFVDEKNIYSLTNQKGYKTIIYDHQLNRLRNIGQYSNTEQPFYLTNQITQIAHKNNKLYYLYPDKIEMINETTGVLIKSITVQGSKMAFDSKSNLWVLSPNTSKIFSYNLDGDLQDEFELENVPNGLEFSFNEGDQRFFFQ